MARSNECQCRVPIAEFGPTVATNRDLAEWVKSHGATLEPDWMGRPSVTVAEAARMFREMHEAGERHAAEQARQRAALDERVASAQQKRQEVWESTYRAHIDRGPAHAMQAAWETVRDTETKLADEVRNRLGGVAIPEVYPSMMGMG